MPPRPPAASLLLLAGALAGCFPGGNDPPVWLGEIALQCEDGVDNDLDGLSDGDDLGCQPGGDDDELLRTDTWLLGEPTCLAAPPCTGFVEWDIRVVLEDRSLYPPEYDVLNDVDCPVGPRVVVAAPLYVAGLPLSATYATAPGACP